MSDKILTISIAAYNVEKYISNTLDSLLVDKVLSDIEVLIIDDGGNDNTVNIAKTYEDKYPDTFKVVHKSNGGYGSTVNYSVKNARGKYFKLLDGDDYFDKDGLVRLIEVLKNNDVDVVFTQYNYAFPDKLKSAIWFRDDKVSKVLDVSDFYLNEGTPMHSITYRTECIRESKMLLKEHVLYTDNTYAAIPFKCVKTILFENFVVYNYRLGLEGQSVNRKSLIKHIEESKDVSINLVNFYKSIENIDLPSKKCIKINVASTCVNYVAAVLKMKMSFSSLKRLKEFDAMIMNISTDIYEKMGTLDRKCSKALNMIRKSGYILYWLFAFVYRFID